MAQNGAAQTLRRVMLGGYRDADPENDQILGAASFAVDLICQQKSPPGAYTFAHSLVSLNQEIEGGKLLAEERLNVRVVKVRQQVSLW